jgi:hypothetical protein
LPDVRAERSPGQGRADDGWPLERARRLTGVSPRQGGEGH